MRRTARIVLLISAIVLASIIGGLAWWVASQDAVRERPAVVKEHDDPVPHVKHAEAAPPAMLRQAERFARAYWTRDYGYEVEASARTMREAALPSVVDPILRAAPPRPWGEPQSVRGVRAVRANTDGWVVTVTATFGDEPLQLQTRMQPKPPYRVARLEAGA